MKHILYLLTIVALASCSAGSDSSFTVEQTECLNMSFDHNNAVDILLEWEQLLIGAGDLDDNSGESYTKLWQRFADSNEYFIKATHDYRLFGNKATISPAEMKIYEVTTCFQGLEGADQVDHLVGKMDQMATEVQAADEMSPKVVADAMLKHTSPSDFEHPYMRYRNLISLYCIISQGSDRLPDGHNHAH